MCSLSNSTPTLKGTCFLLGFGDVFLDSSMWSHLDPNKTQQFADDNPKQKIIMIASQYISGHHGFLVFFPSGYPKVFTLYISRVFFFESPFTRDVPCVRRFQMACKLERGDRLMFFQVSDWSGTVVEWW